MASACSVMSESVRRGQSHTPPRYGLTSIRSASFRRAAAPSQTPAQVQLSVSSTMQTGSLRCRLSQNRSRRFSSGISETVQRTSPLWKYRSYAPYSERWSRFPFSAS